MPHIDELLSSVCSRVDYCDESSLLSSVRLLLTAACLTSTSYSRVCSVIVSGLLLLLLVGRQLTVRYATFSYYTAASIGWGNCVFVVVVCMSFYFSACLCTVLTEVGNGYRKRKSGRKDNDDNSDR